MKHVLRKASFGLAVATLSAMTVADVTASLQLSNMYLFRGEDLGTGDALIAGSLDAEKNGAYIGMWAASGDATLGQEIDFYGGYAFTSEDGNFGVDVGALTYYYPGANSYDVFGSLSEAYITFDVFGAFAEVWKTVADDGGDADHNFYYVLGYEHNGFTVYAGYLNTDMEVATVDGMEDKDYVHIDASFTTSDVPGELDDSLTIGFSQIVHQSADRDDVITASDFREEDLLMYVSYDVSFDL